MVGEREAPERWEETGREMWDCEALMGKLQRGVGMGEAGMGVLRGAKQWAARAGVREPEAGGLVGRPRWQSGG